MKHISNILLTVHIIAVFIPNDFGIETLLSAGELYRYCTNDNNHETEASLRFQQVFQYRGQL